LQPQCYIVRRQSQDCPLSLQWNDPGWENTPALSLRHFHSQSSEHRPDVSVKLRHCNFSLDVLFRVHDRYVKSLATEYQQMVCRDSCVELFVQPKPDRGYFNFEINCGGTMLLYCIDDASRAGNTFAKYVKVTPEHAQQMQILTTMPKTTPIEIGQLIEWSLALRIPVSMLEPYVGAIGDLSGQTWRGNLYKCGDKTSHPHWASWNPIGEKLNFHQPDKFGTLVFA
jgi:hypothetical protein